MMPRNYTCGRTNITESFPFTPLPIKPTTKRYLKRNKMLRSNCRYIYILNQNDFVRTHMAYEFMWMEKSIDAIKFQWKFIWFSFLCLFCFQIAQKCKCEWKASIANSCKMNCRSHNGHRKKIKKNRQIIWAYFVFEYGTFPTADRLSFLCDFKCFISLQCAQTHSRSVSSSFIPKSKKKKKSRKNKE